jgi:NAD(P)-dependent dehydrogenase (short-subunit alcohol dehydrogenase family)
MKIKDSIALVTGSNRGIGRQFIAGLLERGARRVYASARRYGELQPIVALDRSRVVAVKLDITRPREVEAVALAAQDLTLLVNNAGVATFGTIGDASFEAIARDMETNYFGTLRVIRACLPALEKNGAGTVVNILSIAALAGMPGLGGYSASKAAAFSMTQALRGQLAPKGISVHGVFPGPVDTDMARDVTLRKTDARDVVHAVLASVEAGVDDIFPDTMSQEAAAVWLHDPKALERRFSAA